MRRFDGEIETEELLIILGIDASCNRSGGAKAHLIRIITEDEVALDLDFRIDRLLDSGFELSGNAAAEIDATLLFCREAFDGAR